MKLSNKARVRFAPSPTGYLHIGGVRTALFNYLFAKKNKGTFILRIEDTDKERSKPEFEKDILDSLEWLDIKWDELYKQSDRTSIYRKYLEKLLNEGKAYYCFCTSEELEAQRQEQMSRGVAPKYSGRCSNLSKEEIEKNLGKPSVIRFRVASKIVEIDDLIRGKVKFDTNLLGDIVIAKDLDTPIFHFSNVIDDFEMKISHVIRGEEHLSNTSRHILIGEALGFKSPQYGHIPLILAPDRTKLSKRHGAVSLDEYRKQGYLKEAIINFLSFLGWNPGDDKEIYSMKELIKDFSIEKVQKSPAVFNVQKLDYINGSYIRKMPLKELTELCMPYLIGLITPVFEQKEMIPGVLGQEIALNYIVTETKEKITFNQIEKIVSLYQERLKKLSEISELTDFFFKDKLNYDKDLLRWKKIGDSELKIIIDRLLSVLYDIKEWKRDKIEAVLSLASEEIALELKKEKNKGYMLWPFRVALTGKENSAPPFDIAEILGREKTINRVKEALSK